MNIISRSLQLIQRSFFEPPIKRCSVPIVFHAKSSQNHRTYSCHYACSSNNFSSVFVPKSNYWPFWIFQTLFRVVVLCPLHLAPPCSVKKPQNTTSCGFVCGVKPHFGGEKGIRTLARRLTGYRISSADPSTTWVSLQMFGFCPRRGGANPGFRGPASKKMQIFPERTLSLFRPGLDGREKLFPQVHTCRGHFESASLRPLRYISSYGAVGFPLRYYIISPA